MKRTAAAILILVLLGAAINVPVAVMFIRPDRVQRPQPTVNLSGTVAAARGWPFRTPDDQPAWPAPGQWQRTHRFGYRFTQAWSPRDAEVRLSMEYHQYGWPLPVLHRVQMWWPWNDPAWKSAQVSDPALRLDWRGLLLNPLFFGVGAWLVFFAPVHAWVWSRRRLRAWAGRCLNCGYPAGISERCSECGEALPEALRALAAGRQPSSRDPR